MLWTQKKSLVDVATVAMEKLAVPKMKASGLVFLILLRNLISVCILKKTIDYNLFPSFFAV